MSTAPNTSVQPQDFHSSNSNKKGRPNWLLRTVVIIAVLIGGVAIFLPSLCRPRESANIAKCASNLHQIGLAIQLYTQENAEKYPDSLVTLMRSEQLTPAVFVCPSSNDEAADGDTPTAIATNIAKPHHLSYVYIGNGLTTQTVKAESLICYELPENHQQDGMNMLFGDGHAEWEKMAEAKKLIATACPAAK